MIHLISAITCEEHQELVNGDSNYITVFDEVFEFGICNFHLVNKWYGEGEIALERIVVVSPKEEVVGGTEQEFKVDGVQVTLSEMEIDFQEEGIYWIFIHENDKLLNKVPIKVINEV